jgi:mannose-6-phosphate isomerase-like protein (cupin superfamily)
MVKKSLAALGLCAALMPVALAQTESERIDLYFGDWHGAKEHKTHGALEEREIVTRGDATYRSAVLRFVEGVSHATLVPGGTTGSTRLSEKQEIYFVLSGRGAVSAGGKTTEIARNAAVFVPVGLEFVLRSTGDEALEMVVIREAVPAGFHPARSVIVRDENKLPIASSDTFWDQIVKTLFVPSDGLASFNGVRTVTLDPLTVSQPHVESHADVEEVWLALDGTGLAFVGNQLRRQPPGMAFVTLPDRKTPHSAVNPNEDIPVRYLVFSVSHPDAQGKK